MVWCVVCMAVYMYVYGVVCDVYGCVSVCIWCGVWGVWLCVCVMYTVWCEVCMAVCMCYVYGVVCGVYGGVCVCIWCGV